MLLKPLAGGQFRPCVVSFDGFEKKIEGDEEEYQVPRVTLPTLGYVRLSDLLYDVNNCIVAF